MQAVATIQALLLRGSTLSGRLAGGLINKEASFSTSFVSVAVNSSQPVLGTSEILLWTVASRRSDLTHLPSVHSSLLLLPCAFHGFLAHA